MVVVINDVKHIQKLTVVQSHFLAQVVQTPFLLPEEEVVAEIGPEVVVG